MAGWTDWALPIAGAVLGSQNGSQQAGTTTNTVTPWKPLQPYLVGGVDQNGVKIPGIAEQAATLYSQQSQGMPDYLKKAYTSYLDAANLGMGSQANQMLQQNVQNMLAGSNAPQLNTVGNIAAPTPVSATSASAASGKFDLGSLGGVGSSAEEAYKKMLTGNVNLDAYNPAVQAAMQRVTDQFNTQVMPGINQQAVASGQYGGSRQGVAQGLAAKGLSQTMGDMSANMYLGAYNNAQNQMGNAAGQLGGFATNIANNNAAMQTQANMANAQAANQMALANQQAMQQANMFNANLGLQNNQQAMSNYNNQVNALNTAGNLLNNNLTATQNLGMGAINAANAANNYNWQQLGNYQNSVQGLAGLGNQTSTPYYTNPISGALAGAQIGSQIAKNY